MKCLFDRKIVKLKSQNLSTFSIALRAILFHDINVSRATKVITTQIVQSSFHFTNSKRKEIITRKNETFISEIVSVLGPKRAFTAWANSRAHRKKRHRPIDRPKVEP